MEQTKIRAINNFASDNENNKTQDQHIDICNSQGRVMLSAPDAYRTSDEELPLLLEDLNKGELVTSTSVIYNPNNLNAKFIHNFGSRITNPVERSAIFPGYYKEPIEEIIRDDDLYSKILYQTLKPSQFVEIFRERAKKLVEGSISQEDYEKDEQSFKGYGLKFLQALFDTEDDTSKLISRLEKISNKEAKDIRVVTPNLIDRRTRSLPKRAVVLSYYPDGFLIHCGFFFFEDYDNLEDKELTN